ncbi:gamma-glutamyltransferase [Albimonas pacifica]|uniref:Gamma-glutamyltransferase. Threonine peptidase. MEROPS family T03 n=1 Tax=Albimonas pacifica TaxID=1114924 RepID=A0A1I3N1D1_9RHOB|nr:gamma-glutamyltransferase [Albimonas pacifica]SFJ03039.1 gamma-glutamyltransferase. Threonine peptidase. MEROPS family T03 [Albimonas pacifica]
MSRFAIAAGHVATAEAGAVALRAGGTAVDAVVAAALAACAAEPLLAGLFGGGFLAVREASGRSRMLDFFVQTPRRRLPEPERDLRAIEADFGDARQSFHIGAGAIATPGLVPGLAEAHARFGRIPMRELARPALEAAGRGLPFSAFQARVLQVIAPICRATPAARALFCPDGETLAVAGETLANPALADAIDAFAQEGPRLFQEGEIARALAGIAAEGGHLTIEDLAAYRPAWREPLQAERGAARLSLNPGPALGGTLVALALRLAPADASALDWAHALATVAKARAEAEAQAGGDVLARLGEATAEGLRALAARPRSERGTTHVSAVDASGMAAALTLSNGEGCGLVVPGTGTMANNMLGEADLLPRGLDGWRTDVRLASMMAPTAMAWPDGSVAALGSGGSNRIRSAMAQAIARLADRGEALDRAIEAPRLHVEHAPPAGDPDAPPGPSIDFEDRFPGAEREALTRAFPAARPWAQESLFFGGVHAVRRSRSGVVEAAADPRRDGAALTA